MSPSTKLVLAALTAVLTLPGFVRSDYCGDVLTASCHEGIPALEAAVDSARTALSDAVTALEAAETAADECSADCTPPCSDYTEVVSSLEGYVGDSGCCRTTGTLTPGDSVVLNGPASPCVSPTSN
jgi:hypothetical protein